MCLCVHVYVCDFNEGRRGLEFLNDPQVSKRGVYVCVCVHVCECDIRLEHAGERV